MQERENPFKLEKNHKEVYSIYINKNFPFSS